MAWRLNFIENPQKDVPENGWPPGTCWYGRWYFDPQAPDAEEKRLKYLELAREHKKHLSEKYLVDAARYRPPIIVVMPLGVHWNIDSQQVRDGEYVGGGWEVSGELPNISVTPSINMSHYHGFITNGEITDDLEGRTYSR